MADKTYTYTIPDFNLTSTWYRSRYGTSQGEILRTLDLTGASTTRTVDLSDIVLEEGENIKRVFLSASLNKTGTADGGEVIKVNNTIFYTGKRSLDPTTVTAGTNFSLNFYYCASGNAPTLPPINATTFYSSTLYCSNIVLTITTGTGSSFDGKISSLPEGTKILIDEPDGIQGTYSIVHHGYGNETFCLLWRDTPIDEKIAFNHNNDTYLYQQVIGADPEVDKITHGQIDLYLNNTFYANLPNNTKTFIQKAIYPTLSKKGGQFLQLERYICTPSIRELKGLSGAEEWFGTPLNYLETVNCSEVYWTRSVYTSEVEKAWRISDTGNSFNYNRSYSSGVRPCFCVLEDQLATPSTDGTTYILINPVAAPSNVYLNGSTNNLEDLQRDVTITISWDAVNDEKVQGYEVYVSESPTEDFVSCGIIQADDNGEIPTSMPFSMGPKGFAIKEFKVKAFTSPDTSYLDSGFSSVSRTASTKKTNLHYYDGQFWLLAAPKYYNDESTWTVGTKGTKYYDGSNWITPEQ